MIFTFDAKGFLLYPVIKSHFQLDDQDVYQMIQNGFAVLQKQLALKGISYRNLKGALVPNQDKYKFETCFIIDSNQINSSDYGYCVFEKLIPLLDDKSTFSILCGDYVDTIEKYCYNSQWLLYSSLNEVCTYFHTSKYNHSTQYFLIYINRLSKTQRQIILDGLNKYEWFTGMADLTHQSRFKSYISNILTNVCVKNKNKVILPHPSDYSDEKNANLRGFPFESNGFQVYSINENSYGAFLSYKIESYPPDHDDISFSFNALFPKFDTFEKIALNISDNRWNQYLIDIKGGKGRILESLGYQHSDKERFTKEIFSHICANYIYNLRENEYGAFMFDVCVDLPTIHGNKRKTVVGLKYYPDSGSVEVVTIT